MKNDNYKPFTVTMTATFMVYASTPDDAENIVSEALYRMNLIDIRVADTETHWAQAVTVHGHHSTIVRDGESMSDYEAYQLLMGETGK
jgi:hypothetical protein